MPIYFDPQTTAWLDSKHAEWPPTLEEDLLKIYRHNRKVEKLIR